MTLAVSNTPPASAPPATRAGAFAAAWTLLAVAALAYLAVVFRVWMSLPEMNDRFLIPLAAAWLVRRNWSAFRATPASPSAWGLVLLGLAAILAPPAWYLAVQVGPRVVLLWWMLTALVLATMGLLIAQFGLRRAAKFVFPLAFCFLALPTPDRLQSRLQERLKEYTTTATAWALPVIGIPAERRGHTLELKSGKLGVVDACSGVRSVAALTAIALFVAYVRGFSVLRGALLIAATMGIVVVSNAIRVIATGVLQETLGPQFVHGIAHDILGYAVILIGLALIVGVSGLLAPRFASESATAGEPVSVPSARGGFIATALIAASLGACVSAERHRAAHRNDVNLEWLPQMIGDWEGQDAPVAEAVADMLKCDQLLHRVYRGRLGQEIEVYILFWATPASTAHMHHPDICMPCQGWTTDRANVKAVKLSDNEPPIEASVRVYSQSGHRQLVYYWTQTGRDVLPDGKEDLNRVSELGWIAQMLRGDNSIAETSRLAIRIDTDIAGGEQSADAMVGAFAGELARELYSLCPWAKPAKATFAAGP